MAGARTPRALVGALLLTVACGLGPSAGGCAKHREAIQDAEAKLEGASAGREDLQPYLDAISKARRAAEAVGC